MHSASAQIFERVIPRRDSLMLAFSRIFEDALLAAPGYEVPQVEAIFEQAVPALGVRLQTELPRGWRCRVSGSFVHGGSGRYQAQRADTAASCEIGDLLVVVEYRVLGGSSARSGLLIQAKRGGVSASEPWSDTSGKKQRALYFERPPFTWQPTWVGQERQADTRSLEPDLAFDDPYWHLLDHWPTILWWSRWRDDRGEVHAGALFSVLSIPQPFVVPPYPGVEPRPLAAVCADLMALTGGFWFKSRKDAYDGGRDLQWSAVVWDLLGASRKREWRGRPDLTSAALLEDEEPLEAAGGGQPPLDDAKMLSDEQDSGVSVVRIIIDGGE